MNKNNIIGFLLIAVVLIGFSWYNQPSAEEQRAAFVQDSIAKAKHAEMEKTSKAAAEKRQADAKAKIEAEIKNMPNYFADYDTTVHFISQEELDRNHSGIPHGGFVIRSGKTGWDNEYNNIIEYSLKLDSNPAFTSAVLVSYARAVYRMKKEGATGCKTVFDVAPAYLSPLSGEELRAHLL